VNCNWCERDYFSVCSVMQLRIRGVLIVNERVLTGICESLNLIARGLICDASGPCCWRKVLTSLAVIVLTCLGLWCPD
jgi:hypothetical protein